MKKIILILTLFFSLAGASDATIDVVNKGLALPRIIVQDASGALNNNDLKMRFFKMIVGDLKVGSAFEVIDGYFESSYDGDFSTNIAGHGADLILRYELTNAADNLKLRLKILNANNGTVRYEGDFSEAASRYAFLSHKAVVSIARELALAPIEWMDKSVIIAQYTAPGQSSIIVADYTLTYQKTVLSGGLNIFPKWASPEQNGFYFTTYIDGTPTLFHYDLATAKRTKIISSSGMLVASDVSRDGNRLLLTMAPDDQPDIFLYDLSTKKASRITTFSGIDVGGNFIDDDTRVAFVSDRLGYPNVFATGVGGGAVEQMVFHGKNNNSVTTNGNYIVYSSREASGYDASTFNLYLISTKTDYIRQLTAGGINTFPRFSADGGSIVFIKNIGAQSAVGIIRVNENRSFQFPLKIGKLQSIDW